MCKLCHPQAQINWILSKLAANYIAVPLIDIFNLCLNTNVISSIWKPAFVVPLFKRGDPSIFNNHRPISKWSVLVKVLESLVSDPLDLGFC